MSCLLNSPVVDHKWIAYCTEFEAFSPSGLEPPDRVIPLPLGNPCPLRSRVAACIPRYIRSTPRDLYYIVQNVPPDGHKLPTIKIMLNAVLN